MRIRKRSDLHFALSWYSDNQLIKVNAFIKRSLQSNKRIYESPKH